ncbi:MAG TPA: cellulase family glycosylhydrolase [Verrucomicrobiae bacterium]
MSSTTTRRSFIAKAGTIAFALSQAAHAADGPKEPAPKVTWAKPILHNYSDYGWLRGFSMVPSWGARIEDAWWLYDGARMREEVMLAKQVHANCIRLWIEFTAWMADPEKVTAHFLDAVKAIDEAGMKTMPCLFNRWHDNHFDYGGTYVDNLFKNWGPQLDYVRALVTPLAKDNRILIWDLCNEPQTGATWAKEMPSEGPKKEQDWLAAIADTVRKCGVQQPITVGTMFGANIEAFADICDVLCGHPYGHTQPALVNQIADLNRLKQKFTKPMLVNECIPGSLNDQVRADTAKYYDELLSKAGFGWMGWALREGKAISTRRDRYDANGINKEGFHPFFTKEGKLRGGLDFLTQKPALRAPWEKS